MHFWVMSLLIILWWPSDVKSNPIIQADSKGLYVDAQNTSHSLEENPETIEDDGDIMPQIERNAVQHVWKTHVIPYVIDDEISHRAQDILKATKMISDPTCLTFQLRETERDYLFFKNSPGCASFVGCIGGKQPVYIGRLCRVGNIVHEILHALGFFHEHTRLDRDQYVEVLNENIRKGAQKNFVKQSGDTGNVPYDVKSILHYGSQYFSSNGKPTIKSHHPTLDMGQRRKLTTSDIQRIRLLYNCDSSKNVSWAGRNEGQTDDAVPTATPSPSVSPQ